MEKPLNENDKRIVEYLAKYRCAQDESPEKYSFVLNYTGAEIYLAKNANVYPNFHKDFDDGKDIEIYDQPIDCKQTNPEYENMTVNAIKAGLVYIQVIGKYPNYFLGGWISGTDAKEVAQARPNEDMPKYYIIKKKYLHPIDTFKKEYCRSGG